MKQLYNHFSMHVQWELSQKWWHVFETLEQFIQALLNVPDYGHGFVLETNAVLYQEGGNKKLHPIPAFLGIIVCSVHVYIHTSKIRGKYYIHVETYLEKFICYFVGSGSVSHSCCPGHCV